MLSRESGGGGGRARRPRRAHPQGAEASPPAAGRAGRLAELVVAPPAGPLESPLPGKPSCQELDRRRVGDVSKQPLLQAESRQRAHLGELDA